MQKGVKGSSLEGRGRGIISRKLFVIHSLNWFPLVVVFLPAFFSCISFHLPFPYVLPIALNSSCCYFKERTARASTRVNSFVAFACWRWVRQHRHHFEGRAGSSPSAPFLMHLNAQPSLLLNAMEVCSKQHVGCIRSHFRRWASIYK